MTYVYPRLAAAKKLAKKLNVVYYCGSTKNKILRISNCCNVYFTYHLVPY